MTRIYSLQKWILVILLLSSALIFNPFINTEVFEFPKILALIFTSGLLTVITIIDIQLNKLPKIDLGNSKKALLCLGIIFLTQILSYIFSTDRSVSLMGEELRYQGLLTNLHYLLLVLNTFYFFIKHQDEKTNSVFKWLIISLVVSCIFAVMPYFFPKPFPFYFFTPDSFFNRVYGTFGNPNYLAVFIIGTLPFLIFHKNLKKIFLYPTILFCLITLFLTGSRSAWISSILAFLIIGILLVIKNKNYKTLIVTTGIIALSIFAVTIKKYAVPIIPQFERLSLDTEKSTSIQTRLHLWKAGLEMSLKKTLTGYGQDMIQKNIEPYLPTYLKPNDEFFIDRTHSEFIDILVSGGIFNLLAYISLLILVLTKSAKTIIINKIVDPNFLASFTALTGIIIFHAVNFSITSSNILLYFLLGYLLAKNISVYSDHKS